MALDSCELTMDDIEGVCMGTAPDAFDGIHMKGEYLSDGSGAWNKPYMRSFVGGGTGVFAPIQGWYHVASGLFDVVLVVAEEKMSSYYPHAQAAFLTIFDHTTERPLKPNLLWIFALVDLFRRRSLSAVAKVLEFNEFVVADAVEDVVDDPAVKHRAEHLGLGNVVGGDLEQILAE